MATRAAAAATTNNGVVELDGTAGDILTSENFRIETRSLANGTPQIRNVAGNNTIGFVATLYDGDVAGGADSWFIESAGGTLTINGGVSNSFAGTTTVYLQGGGDGVIAGADGLKNDSGVLNVVKRQRHVDRSTRHPQ